MPLSRGKAVVYIDRSILLQENPVKQYLLQGHILRVSQENDNISRLEKELEEAKSRVAFFLGKIKELEE